MSRTASAPPVVLALPPELLTHLLSYADPPDCFHFGLTCKAARTHATAAALWRALFSDRFDPPPPSASNSLVALHHQRLVQQRHRVITLLRNHTEKERAIPQKESERLLRTLVHLALSRSPAAGLVPDASLNETLLDTHLPLDAPTLLALLPAFSRSSSRTLRSASKQPVPSFAALISQSHIAQLASQLHVLATPSPLALRSPSILTFAREIVYEKANYPASCAYGPFTPDGRVDWRKVEALAVTMRANLDPDEGGIAWGWGQEAEGDETVLPVGWGATRALGAGKVRTDVEGRDWAGVTAHEWRGTYSFLHYPVFAHFNWHRSASASAWHPSLADEHEAVGDCMSLKLELLPEGEWPEEISAPRRRGMSDDMDDDDEDDDFEGSDESEDEGMSSGSDGDLGGTATRTTRASRAGIDAAARSSSPNSPDVSLDLDTSDEDGSSYFDDRGGEANTTMDTDVEVDDGDVEEAPFRPLPTSPSSSYSGPAPLEPPLPPYEGFVPAPFSTSFAPSSPPVTAGPSTSASVSSATSSSSPTHPPLAFHGSSTPLAFRGSFSNPSTAANSAHLAQPDRHIRGVVRLVPSLPAPPGSPFSTLGEEQQAVRWSYVIHYGGQDQWALEGVQVSVGNRQGVLGVWSCADRDEEGPCGPFWYWPHIPKEEDV